MYVHYQKDCAEHPMKATLKSMASAVVLCKTKADDCKKQLSSLEKTLEKQIAERAKGDTWHLKHLANATALVNMHIREDIKGDVTTGDAIEHMTGDVCQMQIVESVWSIHEFKAAKNYACLESRLAALKKEISSCFEGEDKTKALMHAAKLDGHSTKKDDKGFDAALDLVIKDVLAMSIATHESEHVAPKKVR